MRCISLINAAIGPDRTSSLRIRGMYIAAVGEPPGPRDRVVDLEGDRLLPGLINAHDHLQLNSFRLPEYGRRYLNAGEWIEDFNARMVADSAFSAGRAIPRDRRLVHGGCKNLLSGVTTVAHHDPFYPPLTSRDYPTQVLAGYGWSHSLGIDGTESVRASFERTPVDQPWIIHAAEGIDAAAAAEFDRLDELGCIGSRTLLVHGVALDGAQRARLAAAGAGLIWCPTSNQRLFGATAEVAGLVGLGRVALGSDSRLTGGLDLLEEVRAAGALGGFDEPTLESLVTESAARLLRLSDRGVLRAGARADLVVLPARLPLSRAVRKDIRLVMLGGSMCCGDRDLAGIMMAKSQRMEIRVEGCVKVVTQRLGAALSSTAELEPGVELFEMAGRAA